MADKKILLISEKQIKENSLIQLNVETKVLGRTILDTQNIYLRPILGNKLYSNVLDEVNTTLTDSGHTMDAGIKALLEDYIQPFLSHAVTQDIIINLHYKITEKGVMQFNDTEANSISANDLEYFRNYIENRTASYKAQLIKYLQENEFIEDSHTDKDITTDSIGWYLPSLNGGSVCG